MDELFVACAEHLEPFLVDELIQLGIKGVRKRFRGASVPKTLENVYTINYLSRIATRVLWPLSEFCCYDKHSLYGNAKEIDWLKYLDETKTCAIDSNITHDNIRHSLYGAQVLKDALCDKIREARGARPSISIKNPDVQLHLFIYRRRAVISLNTSGAPLYRRGWKNQLGEATLPETLAAALLHIAGYTGEEILCDPFCGSGTILIEAALMATRTPPGFFRTEWGFRHLPEHRADQWEAFKAAQDAKRIPLAQDKIFGADKSAGELNICRAHTAQMGLRDVIALTHSEVATYIPQKKPTLIVTDPPFGKRLASSKTIFEDIGRFLKTNSDPGQKVFVLSPNIHQIQEIGWNISSKTPLYHGGTPTALYQLSSHDMYVTNG